MMKTALITLLAMGFVAGFPYSASAELSRSAGKTRPLRHEDEVASSFREALSAAKAETNRTDQIRKALEAVTPALNRQNAALSTPRSRPEKPLSPVFSPASPRRDSRHKGAPSARVVPPPAPLEDSSAASGDSGAIEVPADYPSLIVFERGKAPKVELHDPTKEAPPAQLEFTGRKPRK